jgi:hypothetical protein
MPEMISLRRQRYGRIRLEIGDKFIANQRDVGMLQLAKMARFPSLIEAPAPNPPVSEYQAARNFQKQHDEEEEAAADKAKERTRRTYRRKDMVAQEPVEVSLPPMQPVNLSKDDEE